MEVFDLEMLCDERMLGADIVVEGDFREGGGVGGVRGGGGLAISKEGGDNNEVLDSVR